MFLCLCFVSLLEIFETNRFHSNFRIYVPQPATEPASEISWNPVLEKLGRCNGLFKQIIHSRLLFMLLQVDCDPRDS